MKTLILALSLTLVPTLSFADCTVKFNTSQGVNTFELNPKRIDMIIAATREDRSRPAISCFWIFCSYHKVPSAWVMMTDQTMYRVQDTKDEAIQKVRSCRPSFAVR